MANRYFFGGGAISDENWDRAFGRGKGSSWENPFTDIQDAYSAASENTGEPRTHFVNDPGEDWYFEHLYEADTLSASLNRLSDKWNDLWGLIAKESGLVWLADKINEKLSK